MFECRHAPIVLPSSVVDELVRRYAEPQGAYHTAAHIAEVLRWFDWVDERAGWDAPIDAYLAAVFHDAIYEPLAKDNEARSASLARELAGASERCAEWIRLTARHGSLAPSDVDRDAAHFLDCDMAILGAEPDEFDRYDAAIAFEYKAVPAPMFRAGRGAFLRKLAGERRIFLSELFHAELDARARANLERAIARC